MFKTLGMHLQEQQRALSHFLYSAIHTGELNAWHSDGCAFKDSVENKCDCVLIEAYRVVKNWKQS